MSPRRIATLAVGLVAVLASVLTVNAPEAQAQQTEPETFEILIRSWVPSEIFDFWSAPPNGGDDHVLSSYESQGSYRVEIRFEMSLSTGELVGQPSITGAQRTQYLESQTNWVLDRPHWWDDLTNGSIAPKVRPANLNSVHITDLGDGQRVEFDVPVDFAGDFSAKFDMEFRIVPSESGGLDLQISGQHLAFPNYEVYYDEDQAFRHNTDDGGAGLLYDDVEVSETYPLTRPEWDDRDDRGDNGNENDGEGQGNNDGQGNGGGGGLSGPSLGGRGSGSLGQGGTGSISGSVDLECDPPAEPDTPPGSGPAPPVPEPECVPIET